MNFDSGTTANLEANRFRRMLDVIDQAVVELDADGVVVYANSMSEVVLGLTPDFLVGQPLARLLEPFLTSAGPFPLLSQALEEAQYPVSGETIYDPPSGRQRVLRWSIWQITHAGSLAKSIVTFTDLSERQEAEAKFSAVVEDFLSVVQHRLWTPVLANIRVNELFLDGAFGEVNERQAEVLRAAYANSLETSRLLAILLDLYRYKNGRSVLDLRRCTVRDVLSDVLSDLSERCNTAGLALEVRLAEPDLFIKADRSELAKLFKHLADNALKHARSKISVVVLQTLGYVDVAVEDDGKGLAAEDIPNLFTRFFQSFQRGKYVPVTGAGLCLCAEIAKAHGGFLSCKSKPNHGARFTLTLKVADSD